MRKIIAMHIASIGIDLGKTTFHLVALLCCSAIMEPPSATRLVLLPHGYGSPSGSMLCVGQLGRYADWFSGVAPAREVIFLIALANFHLGKSQGV